MDNRGDTSKAKRSARPPRDRRRLPHRLRGWASRRRLAAPSSPQKRKKTRTCLKTADSGRSCLGHQLPKPRGRVLTSSGRYSDLRGLKPRRKPSQPFQASGGAMRASSPRAPFTAAGQFPIFTGFPQEGLFRSFQPDFSKYRSPTEKRQDPRRTRRPRSWPLLSKAPANCPERLKKFFLKKNGGLL
jgi:hypothetical protein